MKNRTLWFLIALGVTAAIGGSIKTWSSGEVLTASDLNATFQHIHNSMVGGHGARLVNADVNASAAISHSKLATPGLIPKGWVWTPTTCTAGTCALTVNSGATISAVAWNSTGNYGVNLSPTRANANYALIVTPVGTAVFCRTSATPTIGGVIVFCYDKDGAAADAAFSMMLLDDDN